MAIVPMQDPAAAARELRRAVTELGFLGAMLPSNGLAYPLGDKLYWPVYEEANRLGCCLAVHGGCHDRFGLDHLNMYVPVHALGHPLGLTINCASMVYSGVFDRFPKLRVAYLEGGVAWLLLLLERLHDSHEAHLPIRPARCVRIARGSGSGARTSRSWSRADRLYLGIETEELTLPFALKVVGNKPFLYSSDFPHEVTLESCTPRHRRAHGERRDHRRRQDRDALPQRRAVLSVSSRARRGSAETLTTDWTALDVDPGYRDLPRRCPLR